LHPILFLHTFKPAGHKRPARRGGTSNQNPRRTDSGINKMKIDKTQLTAALAAAIRDIAENGGATPNNPAILLDGHSGKIAYGSTLTNIYPEDRILLDLQEGVGGYECTASDDIHAVASQWAADIIDDLQREIDEEAAK
jgi:hypothetical protein